MYTTKQQILGIVFKSGGANYQIINDDFYKDRVKLVNPDNNESILASPYSVSDALRYLNNNTFIIVSTLFKTYEVW